jgi:putative ABC transport system permease protein
VLLIALRDLQFRLRRFLISVVAVALVLTLTLLLSGVAAAFDREVDQALDRSNTDVWMVAAEASGPFLGAIALPDSRVEDVLTLPGVTAAAALGFTSTTRSSADGAEPVAVFGVDPGGVGSPPVDEGVELASNGQVVVDSSIGALGETFELGGRSFDIVGRIGGATVLAGQPVVYLTIADLQQIAYSGAPVITSVGVRGTPSSAPDGLRIVTRDQARDDLLRPIAPAKQTITLLSVLLWIVAGCIIGSVIYLSALERVRDFAVFKAIGVSTRDVLFGLVLQAAFLALLASLIAIVVARLLVPVVAMPVALPIGIVLTVPAIALVVSVVGSLVGVRRAVKVDPALAFG